MKKIIVIVLVVGMIAGLIVPLLNDENKIEGDPISFSFKENLASRYGEVIPVDFEVKAQMASVSLVFNDSVFKTWTDITGKETFSLDASFYGLGVKSIELNGKDEDGNKYTDRRLLMVVSDIEPERWDIEIVKTYLHDNTHFTQGLEFSNGKLYQGTGDPSRRGNTMLGVLDLNTGKYTDEQVGLDATHLKELPS